MRRSLLAFLTVSLASALLAADNPAPAKPAEPVLELPKIQITGPRVKKIDKEIARLDKLIVRAKAKVKSTDLDRALNNAKVAKAAAIFGGNSSEHLSAIEAYRVVLLENERDIFEAMKRPATVEEFKLMEAQIEQIRITRRDLDDAAKQR